MRRPIRNLTLAVILASAATAAFAQSNPISRGQHDSFYYGAIKTQNAESINAPLGSSATGTIARPAATFGPVTPVPEPSEWAMLLAGLALVGFIVRRNAKRP